MDKSLVRSTYKITFSFLVSKSKMEWLKKKHCNAFTDNIFYGIQNFTPNEITL